MPSNMTSNMTSKISKPMHSRLIVLSGALLLAGTTAFAQISPGGGAGGAQSNPASPGQTAPGQNSPLNGTQAQQQDPTAGMQDKAFVHNAMEGGMAEVELGQLAAQKGSSDDVKQFGQKMVDDHTKLNDQMKPIAQQLGINPPEKLSKKDRALQDHLQSLSGSQFDNAYIEAMVKDHKKDLDDFKNEAQQTQNQQLQQAVQQGGQVIAQHLQMIEQIAQAHNVSTGKGKGSSGGL
jgi:putative membrane protein